MNFDSSSMIVILAILFVVIGVAGSVIYYFARYYVKTDHKDPELWTKKPLEYGIDDPRLKEIQTAPDDTVQKKSDSEPAVVEAKAAPQPATVHGALEKTRGSLWGKLKSVLTGRTELNQQDKEQLEEILFMNDLGPKTAAQLLERAMEAIPGGAVNLASVAEALKNEMLSIFEKTSSVGLFDKVAHIGKPAVWMVVGVNGVGKTTTIGKLASQAKAKGLKTLIVAGDTFRAAADEQLKQWAERAQVEYFSPQNTKDPSAVGYAGLEKAKSEQFDLVIIDTAGRLHTQGHLMEELKKMSRVLTKVVPDAPHERVLVVDSNSGQNAFMQAKEFHNALQLTGFIVSKLDGSSKGGVTVGIANELAKPVYFIGVGEGVNDLKPFSAKDFVDGIIS